MQEQLDKLRSELSSQKAETAAAVATHRRLDNLVRELRRDNVELRDQLAKVDDTENSLTESDKPIAAAAKQLEVSAPPPMMIIANRFQTDELLSK